MKTVIKKEAFLLKKFIQTLNREMIPLEIVDTSGERHLTSQQGIRHKLLIKDPKFFSALARPTAFSLGEAYIKGYFDISGSIGDLYEIMCDKILATYQPKSIRQFWQTFCSRFVNPRQKEKGNIEYHYDVPSKFFRLFLGKTMGYTCGYYAGETAGMSDAQNEKMDIICRKLKLKGNEKLLDIGCGWGNFAVFAAKHYGVDVTGITLSSEQRKYALEWIEKEGLSQKINIEILNYRDLGTRRFDKVSCIGMSEHVGKTNMPEFFKTVFDSLKVGGLFMQHTITTNTRRKKGHENTFQEKYMFPGGDLLFENDLVHLASSAGFELLNAENFRLHYVKTLDDWIVRMEKHREKLLQLVSENIYRIYHVYFIGSLISFKKKEISLFQNLYYKTEPDITSTDSFLSAYSAQETRI